MKLAVNGEDTSKWHCVETYHAGRQNSFEVMILWCNNNNSDDQYYVWPIELRRSQWRFENPVDAVLFKLKFG